jgi:hypothetical protein
MKIEIIQFHTVGQLKKALGDLPDDRLIICQVVSKDGKAWNLWGEFCPQISNSSNMACLTLKHDQLTTLPNVEENFNNYK